MSTAQHAGRILAAWKRADAAAFEVELEGALVECRTGNPVSTLESEQRELLESVAERLRRPACDGHVALPVNAGLALLRHLEARAVA